MKTLLVLIVFALGAVTGIAAESGVFQPSPPPQRIKSNMELFGAVATAVPGGPNEKLIRELEADDKANHRLPAK